MLLSSMLLTTGDSGIGNPLLVMQFSSFFPPSFCAIVLCNACMESNDGSLGLCDECVEDCCLFSPVGNTTRGRRDGEDDEVSLATAPPVFTADVQFLFDCLSPLEEGSKDSRWSNILLGDPVQGEMLRPSGLLLFSTCGDGKNLDMPRCPLVGVVSGLAVCPALPLDGVPGALFSRGSGGDGALLQLVASSHRLPLGCCCSRNNTKSSFVPNDVGPLLPIALENRFVLACTGSHSSSLLRWPGADDVPLFGLVSAL